MVLVPKKAPKSYDKEYLDPWGLRLEGLRLFFKIELRPFSRFEALGFRVEGFRVPALSMRTPTVDDINPAGVPLKGPIRVPLRGSFKGIYSALGFRV